MDVTKTSDVQNAVNTIIKQEGKIDVLWNNAGYGLYGAVEDIPIEEARQQFEVNLFGLYFMRRKLAHTPRADSVCVELKFPADSVWHFIDIQTVRL